MGLESAVVNEHPHRPDLGERLAKDSIVDEDIAVGDPDRLAREADHPFHVGLRGLAGKVEDRHFPIVSGFPAKLIQKLLDQDAVAAAFDRRTVIEPALSAVGADRFAGLTFVLDAHDKNRVATGARYELAMEPEKSWSHRPGRHDIGLGRKRSHQHDAQAEGDDQLDRLAHDSPPRDLTAAPPSIGLQPGGAHPRPIRCGTR